jgi:hypothetical protein
MTLTGIGPSILCLFPEHIGRLPLSNTFFLFSLTLLIHTDLKVPQVLLLQVIEIVKKKKTRMNLHLDSNGGLSHVVSVVHI